MTRFPHIVYCLYLKCDTNKKSQYHHYVSSDNVFKLNYIHVCTCNWLVLAVVSLKHRNLSEPDFYV